MRFAGDSDLKIYPALSRQQQPEFQPELPDLRVLPKTIWDTIGFPRLRIHLWLKNEGHWPIRDLVTIDFLLDGELIRREVVPPPGEGEEMEIPVTLDVHEGSHMVEIILDPENRIEELDEENNTFVFELEAGAGPAPGSPCIGFEDPTSGSYTYPDHIFDAGASISVLPFEWGNGQWTYDGFLDLRPSGLAGGSGKEAGTNNVNLGVVLPRECEAVSFRFGEYGGNLNLGINGDFRNFENYADVHMTMIGGVLVSVTNGHGNDRGVIELRGAIGQSQFMIDNRPVRASIIIGGQELWIDDLCCE